jgi:hypothetical protein
MSTIETVVHRAPVRVALAHEEGPPDVPREVGRVFAVHQMGGVVSPLRTDDDGQGALCVVDADALPALHPGTAKGTGTVGGVGSGEGTVTALPYGRGLRRG